MSEVKRHMLYNTHLGTFIKVVEAGSFRKAAEGIGISPSSVLKQITLLEDDLGVSVFDRSRKGVTLTEAGESVYRDAKYIVRYCGNTEDRARELSRKEKRIVRIAVSPMNPPDLLVSLWPKIRSICPDIRCRFTAIEDNDTGPERAFSTIGQDADVILGVFDEAFLKHFGLNAVKLTATPASAAYSPDARWVHEYTDKKTPFDLNGKTILVPKKGVFASADAFRREAKKLYPRVVIEDFSMYSLDLYYACAESDKLILTYDVWEMGHMLLDTMPLKGNYESCFGAMSAKEPPETVGRFMEAVRKAVEEK